MTPTYRPGSDQRADHGPGLAVLAHRPKAPVVVEVEGRVVLLDAEAHGLEALATGSLHGGLEQLLAHADPPLVLDDGHGELGRVLVDESVASLVGPEQPPPGGPDRAHADLGDHAPVTLAP